MKKGDVGMAKRFSKKYGNKGWVSTTSNPMSRFLSVPDATSLRHCLKNRHQYCTILCWIQALDTMRPVASLVKGEFVRYMPSPFYPSGVVLFQFQGGMVSHMQVLATHFSIVHNTKYLDPYLWNHISFSCYSSWGSDDVASGAYRHLDIGLLVVEAHHPLFPYILEKRLAIPTSPFFIY